MSRRYLLIYTLLAILFVLQVSCASTTGQLNPQWTEDVFFKNAQEAMDENRYETALFYYEVFLVRYPENHQKVIAAEYERAFINYKMGNYKEATRGYDEIILKYDESPYAMLYHPRFHQLSEIGLVNIEKQKAVKNRLLWRVKEKAWADENGESLTDDGEESLI
jgi:tetratricopeptide (TPR) repeat protein